MCNAGEQQNTLHTCESKEWMNTVWRASVSPSPPPAWQVESVACWDRGSACRGSTMTGGWILGPPLVLGLVGRSSQSARHSGVSRKPAWLWTLSLLLKHSSMFISRGFSWHVAFIERGVCCLRQSCGNKQIQIFAESSFKSHVYLLCSVFRNPYVSVMAQSSVRFNSKTSFIVQQVLIVIKNVT